MIEVVASTSKQLDTFQFEGSIQAKNCPKKTNKTKKSDNKKLDYGS